MLTSEHDITVTLELTAAMTTRTRSSREWALQHPGMEEAHLVHTL